MSTNSVNVKLLRRIKKHILEEPKRFDMLFIRNPLEGLSKELIPECGTVCCIGGWAIKFSYPKAIPDIETGGQFWQVNAEALGAGEANRLIRGREAHRLLFDRHWPEEFRRQYNAAKTPVQKAAAGAAAIDSYIKAKGDWSAIGL